MTGLENWSHDPLGLSMAAVVIGCFYTSTVFDWCVQGHCLHYREAGMADCMPYKAVSQSCTVAKGGPFWWATGQSNFAHKQGINKGFSYRQLHWSSFPFYLPSFWPSAQKVSLLATVHDCETGFLGLRSRLALLSPVPCVIQAPAKASSTKAKSQHKLFPGNPYQSKGATPKHGMSVFWKRWIIFGGIQNVAIIVGDRFLPHKIILVWDCKQWLL